ncbi:hypothetical protein D1BOALGB6SA_5569 [Olavius sp. associated proteobacterium Delta 1]|nr:hypothetical protein D1BOALGB6SA_5569 [Olavius sp. associated proteobacterium Delta 1]
MLFEIRLSLFDNVDSVFNMIDNLSYRHVCFIISCYSVSANNGSKGNFK